MGSPRLSAQDHEFVTKAAAGGMMENEAGQLAMQKGNSQAVKDFGQRMVNDHSKANEKLKALAESKGISVPSTLDAEGRKKTSQLAAKSGDAFDKAYAGMMLKDHQKVIALFERQQSSGTDEDLKSFAAETLPTLRDHLKAAQDLPGNARGGSASSQ